MCNDWKNCIEIINEIVSMIEIMDEIRIEIKIENENTGQQQPKALGSG